MTLEEPRDALDGGDDVEGRGQGAALLEVGHPELGAGELPFGISVVLGNRRKFGYDLHKSSYLPSI